MARSRHYHQYACRVQVHEEMTQMAKSSFQNTDRDPSFVDETYYVEDDGFIDLHDFLKKCSIHVFVPTV